MCVGDGELGACVEARRTNHCGVLGRRGDVRRVPHDGPPSGWFGCFYMYREEFGRCRSRNWGGMINASPCEGHGSLRLNCSSVRQPWCLGDIFGSWTQISPTEREWRIGRSTTSTHMRLRLSSVTWLRWTRWRRSSRIRQRLKWTRPRYTAHSPSFTCVFLDLELSSCNRVTRAWRWSSWLKIEPKSSPSASDLIRWTYWNISVYDWALPRSCWRFGSDCDHQGHSNWVVAPID